MLRRGFLVSTALVLLAGRLFAQDRFFHLGARASAMGGAFTAVADDATAFYWNPAGYVFGPFLQAGFQWGETDMDRNGLLEGLGSEAGRGELFMDRATGFSLGYTFMGVAGTFAKQTTSVRRGELVETRALDTFDLTVSILQSLPLDNLVVAANLHYLDGEAFEESAPAVDLGTDRDVSGAIFDAVRATEGVSSRAGSLDVAVLYEPRDPGFVRIGFTWRRLVEPGFRLPSGDEIVLPRHARAGVAIALARSTLVAADVDVSRQGESTLGEGFRELSLGVSKSFFEGSLSVRGGVRAELGSEAGARPAFSLGAGGRVSWLLFDLAYVGSSGGRDESLWFGVTAAP